MNLYHFDKEKLSYHDKIAIDSKEITKQQSEIFELLNNFIEERTKAKLTDEEKLSLKNDFLNFLLDDAVSEKQFELISAFIISQEKNKQFNSQVNSIKEGLIIYNGICYTSDINQLGSWKDEMTLYMSTENLFSAYGLNGSLFKEIFDDFLKLVNEINRNYKGKLPKYRTKLVELKYLYETKSEIDWYFKMAESIKKGYNRLNPSKLAMANILKGCNDVSDIRTKQIEFFNMLHQNGISALELDYASINLKYNVVDEKIIKELKDSSESQNRRFNEKYCNECLRIFTKINAERRGINNTYFEKCKHMYITENNFSKYLAHNPKVKFAQNDISFAKDLDYVISKFWFKLKKGFGKSGELPKSLNVLNKAKIVISAHLNNSVSENYDDLKERFTKGKLSEAQAIEFSQAFKEKPNAPEMLNAENIVSTLDFLDDENQIEKFLREKTKADIEYQTTLQEKHKVEAELKKYKQREIEEQLKKRQEVINKDAENYSNSQWNLHVAELNSNLNYFFGVALATILPILIAVLLKVNPTLNAWMEGLGQWKFSIWAILVIILLTEMLGRSYIFNKERVRSGYNRFIKIISGKSKNYKSIKLNEFSGRYKQMNQ